MTVWAQLLNASKSKIKGLACYGLLIASSTRADEDTDPTISSGSAAPSAAEPAGSMYLRQTGAGYLRSGGAWSAISLLGATNDFGAAVTAADELINADLSVNHATAQGIGLDASVIQLTTARSSGTMAAIAGKTTSLAGDSGGTYADFWARAPTDGGGSAVHTALLVGAGHDSVIDSSGAASGETDWILGDNLADALTLREGANAYVTFVTTNSGEKVNFLKALDLDSTVDHDVALTAAGDGYNLLTTVDHATGSVEAIDASAQAITTARTGGTLAAVKASLVGLAGDTSGATFVGLDGYVTKNGGSAVACFLRQGAGFDAILDLTGIATGEGDVLLKDNLAEAFQIREGANAYLTVVTTDSGEKLVSGQRLTTTDGVASGTERVVGGRAFSQIADSTSIAGGAGAQAYDQSYTIPANTLKAGSTIRVVGQVKATAQNGSDTFLAQIFLGSTLIATTTAKDIAANDRAYLTADLTVRAAPGAAVAVVYGGIGSWSTAGDFPVWTASSATFDTTGTLAVTLKITYGSSNAGNTSVSEQLTVDIF